MVLKKPYAFLIKYFKLIHLCLTMILFYLSFKITNILFFFNDFIKVNKIDFVTSLPNKYVGIILYVALLLIIGINIFIILLMHYKKKPITFYIINVIFTLICFFVLTFTHNTLYLIETNQLDIKNILINRDVIFVTSIVSYFLILMNLYRASGFNLKKFNFEKDKETILLEEKDNEEIEVELNIDTDKIGRKLNKRKRVLKYFYIENKFLINFIIITVLTFTVTIITINYTIINKKYQEKEYFVLNGIKYEVLNSYKTNLSYNGEDIGKNKYYYTIVKVQLENLTNKEIELKKNIFRLKINNKYFDINSDKVNYFFDLGRPLDNKLYSKEKKVFTLAFEYDNKLEKTKKEFQVFKSGNYKKQELKLNYNKVVLNDKYFKKQDKTVKQKEELILNSDVYLSTNLKVNDYEFKDKFMYKYEFCLNDKCSMLDDFIKSSINNYVSTIIRLNLNIIFDENIDVFLRPDEFIYKYGSFVYTKNNKQYNYSGSIINRTPDNNNNIYLEVSKSLIDEEELFLKISIRNEKYLIKLK
ncbi:MAG: hypothetical protein RR359_01385 [Bacilli bacterium]